MRLITYQTSEHGERVGAFIAGIGIISNRVV